MDASPPQLNGLQLHGMWLTPKFPQACSKSANPVKAHPSPPPPRPSRPPWSSKSASPASAAPTPPFTTLSSPTHGTPPLRPSPFPIPPPPSTLAPPPTQTFTNHSQLTISRTARNSRPLEVLGTYDPIPKRDTYDTSGAPPHKDVKLDIARAQYWVGVGAQPSDTARRLLSMVRFFFPVPFYPALLLGSGWMLTRWQVGIMEPKFPPKVPMGKKAGKTSGRDEEGSSGGGGLGEGRNV